MLSLCMIVKDEEHNLPRCLDSVIEIIDQLVIVDTGSKDRTEEIARQYHAELYHFPWQGNFSEARNESLRHARGKWILVLDADDELSAEARSEIPSLITSTCADAIGLVIRNLSPVGDFVRYVDDVRFRLFRNGKGYSYEYKVHNQIAPSIYRQGGKTIDSNLVIFHHGYRENFQAKARRSLPLIEKALQADPHNVYLQFKKAESLKALGERKLSLEAFEEMLTLNYTTLSPEIISTAYMRMAQLELSFNNYSMCLNYALNALKIRSDNPIAKYLAGIASVYLTNYREALCYFLELQEMYPDDYLDKSDLNTLIQICRIMLLQNSNENESIIE